MQATSFFSPGRPDKNFTIAIALISLAWRSRVDRGRRALSRGGCAPRTSGPTGGRRHRTGRARDRRPASLRPPPSDPSAAPAAAAPPQLRNLPRAPPRFPPPRHLLKEATLLRERGDTNNALARLQDASQRDPKNANVLAEMAMIYESMQLLDRSNETWRKIQEIGPSAGALYELADMKLKVGPNPTAANAAPPATAAGPGFAGVSPLDAGTSRNDPEGIPIRLHASASVKRPSPKLRIAEADTNLTLRVGVKSRANTILDHTKVKIQVYFYDTVDNNKVALTDAEVNYEWLTPNHDWKRNNPEILAVSYVRLKNGAVSSEAALTEAAAAVTPPAAERKRAPRKSRKRKPAHENMRAIRCAFIITTSCRMCALSRRSCSIFSLRRSRSLRRNAIAHRPPRR